MDRHRKTDANNDANDTSREAKATRYPLSDSLRADSESSSARALETSSLSFTDLSSAMERSACALDARSSSFMDLSSAMERSARSLDARSDSTTECSSEMASSAASALSTTTFSLLSKGSAKRTGGVVPRSTERSGPAGSTGAASDMSSRTASARPSNGLTPEPPLWPYVVVLSIAVASLLLSLAFAVLGMPREGRVLPLVAAIGSIALSYAAVVVATRPRRP